MSDKSSESFEEWFNSHDDSERFRGAGVIIGKLAWNARGEIEQKKIDELEAKLDTKFKTPPIVFTLEEKLQAAEEENRILREAVDELVFCSRNFLNPITRCLSLSKRSLISAINKGKQALEKVEKK